MWVQLMGPQLFVAATLEPDVTEATATPSAVPARMARSIFFMGTSLRLPGHSIPVTIKGEWSVKSSPGPIRERRRTVGRAHLHDDGGDCRRARRLRPPTKLLQGPAVLSRCK